MTSLAELKTKAPEIGDADYLGDEWREAGAMAGFEVAIDQGPGLFLAAVGVFVVAAGAAFAALWYLTAPRLAALTPMLPNVLLAAGGLLFLYLLLEYLALTATVYTGKGLALPLARSSGAVVKLLPAARRLARLFGSTPDRMAHSAVRVSNAVTRAARRRRGGEGPVLVLLPRCVQRPGCQQPSEGRSSMTSRPRCSRAWIPARPVSRAGPPALTCPRILPRSRLRRGSS